MSELVKCSRVTERGESEREGIKGRDLVIERERNESAEERRKAAGSFNAQCVCL